MQTSSTITSESIVLGGLINDLNKFIEIPMLKVDYFTSNINKTILKELKKAYQKGSNKIDILDLYGLLESDSNIKTELDEDLGGLEYLSTLEMIGKDKTIEELIVHVENIISYRYKQDMTGLLVGLSNKINLQNEINIGEINKNIESELANIKAKYQQTDKIVSLGDKIEKIRKELDSQVNGNIAGYPTFSPLLNRFVTYEKGEMVVISARAKTGKSQYVINEIYNLAIINKIPCAILDTELSTTAFTMRLVSRITGYSFDYIKKQSYKPNERQNKKVEDAYEMIAEAPIFHQYIVGWDHTDIENELKRLKIQENLQILFYDYLKINDAGDGEHKQLGNLTNFLKNDIAGKLKLAVIALAQQSDYQDRGLRIADSERIKNYASTIIFLVRKTKELYERDLNEMGGTHYLFVLYNRNGTQMDTIQKQDMGVNITFTRNNATMSQADYQCEEITKLLDED